jgi:hypothetical protein
MPHQLLTISHHVGRITLHNPPANVLNLSVLKELDLVLSELEEDDYVRVVIVTGTGRFFCAGADINELAHLHTEHGGAEFASRGQALLNRIERSDSRFLPQSTELVSAVVSNSLWPATFGWRSQAPCWGFRKSNSVSSRASEEPNGCRESLGLPKRRK